MIEINDLKVGDPISLADFKEPLPLVKEKAQEGSNKRWEFELLRNVDFRVSYVDSDYILLAYKDRRVRGNVPEATILLNWP